MRLKLRIFDLGTLRKMGGLVFSLGLGIFVGGFPEVGSAAQDIWYADLPYQGFLPPGATYEYLYQDGRLWFRERGGQDSVNEWLSLPHQITEFRAPYFLGTYSEGANHSNKPRIFFAHGHENGSFLNGAPRGGVWSVRHGPPNAADKFWVPHREILSLSDGGLFTYRLFGQRDNTLGALGQRGMNAWSYDPKFKGESVRGIERLEGRQFQAQGESFFVTEDNRVVQTSGRQMVIPAENEADSSGVEKVIQLKDFSSGNLIFTQELELYLINPRGQLVEVKFSDPADKRSVRNPKTQIQGSLVMTSDHKVFAVVPQKGQGFQALKVDLDGREPLGIAVRGKALWVFVKDGEKIKLLNLADRMRGRGFIREVSGERSENVTIRPYSEEFEIRDSAPFTNAMKSMGLVVPSPLIVEACTHHLHLLGDAQEGADGVLDLDPTEMFELQARSARYERRRARSR